MTESHQNGHEDQERISDQGKNSARASENDPDIIELSDIAIGITPEDDAIVELTEEIIGEAFDGFTGATSEILHEDERELDLSHMQAGVVPSGELSAEAKTGDISGEEPGAIAGQAGGDEDDEISRELDNYFGTEEDRPVPEKSAPVTFPAAEETPKSRRTPQVESTSLDDIRISATHLDEAIERVIRKLFAEKINRILDDVIERTVSEEISQLRDYLLGVSGKK